MTEGDSPETTMRNPFAASLLAPSLLSCVLLSCTVLSGSALATTPPGQPDKGPGGAEYPLPASDVKKDAFGAGAQQVFVFSPAKPSDKPRPVVVMLHAYGAFNPKLYGAWIEHLVRRDSIVVFPRYQLDARTPRAEITAHAATGLRLALERLGAQADLARVAYVGHASGGLIAANLAAGAGGAGIPRPRLVFALNPAMSKGSARLSTPLADMAKMPEDVVLLTLTSESDNIARDSDARRLLRETSAVPPPRKMLFKMATDTHGTPSLFATHIAPMGVHDSYEMDQIPVTGAATPEPARPTGRGGRAAPTAAAVKSPQPEQFGQVTVDALDWQGFWKILDIAMPVAFAGQDTTPIKNAPGLTAMGQWSDGWPVKRLAFESAREVKPEDDKPKPAPAIVPKQRVKQIIQ